MATIAIYSSKGGVGKTTLAINLAWEAVRAGHKTLLWEIDGQGDSSWMMSRDGRPARVNAAKLTNGTMNPVQHIGETWIPNLHLLAADSDLSRTDNFFAMLVREQRLAKLLKDLEAAYDVIILDCPPGFSDANRKILLFVNLVVVPVIPSSFAYRAMLGVRDFMTRHRGYHPPLLPIFSMVDRRRKLHAAALMKHPDWLTIPMSSAFEHMTDRKLPIGILAPKSPGAAAISLIWAGVQNKLRKMVVLKTNTTSSQPCAAAVAYGSPDPRATSRASGTIAADQ